ncbi:MAG TPA: TlpA family protein disulfide reductase, partial [Thermomicrobiales bacterium]|nr:TlpA family protein disulfide reductase [Thermomicrobiales bacterium]
AELGIAVALVPTATARWGALAALALLLVFIAAIAYNLARDRHPACHCFGQLHSEPVGWPILLRNGALAVLAAALALAGWDDPGPSVTGWLSDVSTVAGVALALGVLALALIAAQSWAVAELFGQNGRLLLRIDELEARLADLGASPGGALPDQGLPIGAPAPGFALARLDGGTRTLDELRAAGKPVALVFSDAGCGPCTALLPELGRWRHDHAGDLTLALLSFGAAEEIRAKTEPLGMTGITLLPEAAATDAYLVTGTPSAVIVRPDGAIASPLAVGAGEIIPLLDRALTMPPTAGMAAPELTLPDLDGDLAPVTGERDRPTLLLFWSPGCGFCAEMLDDLRAWENAPPTGAPTLRVVSSGDVASNRALGLRSPILLDQDFAAGSAFGATGTPSAILIDAAGRIASPVAVGAAEVLALAHTPATG